MEIQIKTTTKPTAYPFRMAEIIIKNLTIPSVDEDVGWLEFSYIASGSVT